MFLGLLYTIISLWYPSFRFVKTCTKGILPTVTHKRQMFNL